MRRIGCLVLVALYFLLWVGEYTKPRFVVRDGEKVPATRTKQFVIENIGLFSNVMVIPHSYPLDVLLTADLAVMKISNKKMAVWDKLSHNTPREHWNAQF